MTALDEPTMPTARPAIPVPASTIPVMRPWLGVEEAEAAAGAVASGWVAQGPRVGAFERAFAKAVGAEHAVAVSSCTTALHLALVAAGIAPGDDVIVPSLSFIATANVVRYVGARAVFADVDPATLDLTAPSIEAVLTPATRAVIVVHQAGIPANLHAIERLCQQHSITIIEDAACAIGATYKGHQIGGSGHLAAFSFHPRKLVTTGEGGMIVTDDEAVAARLRRLREHGMSVSAADRHATAQPVLEQYLECGFNYRMTDVQAAIGLVQLGRLDAMIERRRELAARYQHLLAAIPAFTSDRDCDPLQTVSMAADPPYGTTNFQSFWVLLPAGAPARDAVLAHLASRGVSARRGIMAAHLEPAYDGHPHAPLPLTERLSRDSVILPLFHEMTSAEQDHVVASLAEALGGATR